MPRQMAVAVSTSALMDCLVKILVELAPLAALQI